MAQLRGPGPNDFHFADGVLKPGLGADEPSEQQRAAVADAVAEDNERRAALERAAAELEKVSVALDDRTASLEAREQALLAREAALGAAVETIDSAVGATGKGNVAKGAKLATERATGS